MADPSPDGIDVDSAGVYFLSVREFEARSEEDDVPPHTKAPDDEPATSPASQNATKLNASKQSASTTAEAPKNADAGAPPKNTSGR